MRGSLRALMGFAVAVTLLVAGQNPVTSWSASSAPLLRPTRGGVAPVFALLPTSPARALQPGFFTRPITGQPAIGAGLGHGGSSYGTYGGQVVTMYSPGRAAGHGAPGQRVRTTARRRTVSQARIHPVPVIPHLFPHAIGALFGVGSFVAQRSGRVAPLVVGRAALLGAEWVREEFTASRLHDGPNAPYDWQPYDRVIDRERHAGLQILGLLDYSNTWNEGDHAMMPHRDIGRLSADFARYAYAVVRHFRGRIGAWEVWNEPDLPLFWRPAPNPDDYARLLGAAYRAIKRANPRAQVVLAGMSRIDLPFLRRVIVRTHSFDVISVHPYRNLPEPELLAQIAALRVYHKPVWFSEIGWAAGDGCRLCTDEDSQADYLVRFYTLSAAAGVQRVFWYDLRDDVDNPVSPEAHFGLLQHDLAGKPAFVAYQLLSRLLTGASFVGAGALGQNGVYALRFRSRREPLAILWNTGDVPGMVEVPWQGGKYDVLGRDGTILAEMRAWGGRASWLVEPGGAPVYLTTTPWPSLTLPAALLRPPPPPRPPLQRRPAFRRPSRRRITRALPRKAPTHPLPRPTPRRPADRGAARAPGPPPGSWASAPEVHRGHRTVPRRRTSPATLTPTASATGTPTESMAVATATPAPWPAGTGSASLFPASPSPTATTTATATPGAPPTPTSTPVAAGAP